MPPNKGDRYQRLYGDKEVVVVESLSPTGYIKIRDNNGIHFVRAESFDKHFKKIEKGG